MAEADQSCAKQIVDTNNNQIVLNEELLRELLLQPDIKDKNVCVVSITGTFRQGKSFFLNFLVRYLRLKYKTKELVPEKWLDPKDGDVKGFPWRSGIDRDTLGISMWSEIFSAELPSGEEIAIILLDTQGTFDNQTTAQQCAAIFAISTLISSVQLFNLKGQIAQYDLDHLKCFSGYGQLALDKNSEVFGPPFQNLCFLIRDWQYNFEHEYGLKGGKEYLVRLINSADLPSELKTQGEDVSKLFDNIECCLMPHPGQIVANSPTFEGRFSDIDPDFMKHVEKFIPTILAPENLVPKVINGSRVTVSELISYFQAYCQYFVNGKVPPINTMYMAASEAQFKNIVNELENMYTAAMDNHTNDQNSLKSDVLKEHHDEEKRKIIYLFNDKKNMGNAEIKKKFKQLLKNNLEQNFLQYQKLNRVKQETEEEFKKQEENFKNHQKEEYGRAQTMYDQENQRELNELRKTQFKLELKLLEEQNKHSEEKMLFEFEKIKQDQLHKDDLQNKEKEVNNEKQKRWEEQLAHQEAMMEEQMRRKDVEMELKLNSETHKIKVQHMQEKNEHMKEINLKYEEKTKNLKKDMGDVFKVAEGLKRDKEDLIRQMNEQAKEAEARRREWEEKQKGGCVIA